MWIIILPAFVHPNNWWIILLPVLGSLTKGGIIYVLLRLNLYPHLVVRPGGVRRRYSNMGVRAGVEFLEVW